MRHSLLIVARRGMALRLDQRDCSGLAILALLVLWVDRKTLLEGLHRLVVLLLQLMTCAFTGPRLDELVVKLNRLLSVLEGTNRLHELDVGKSPVTVNELIVGISFYSLIEFFNGTWEVASLEKFVTLLFVLLGHFWVDIGLRVTDVLLLLNLLHGLLNVEVVELEQSLTVDSKRVLQLALLKESICLASKRLTKLLVVIVALLGYLDCLIALFEHIVVLTHLKVDGSEVGVERHFLRVELDSFRVELDSVWEILGFVGSVTFELLGICVASELECSLLVVWESLL